MYMYMYVASYTCTHSGTHSYCALLVSGKDKIINRQLSMMILEIHYHHVPLFQSHNLTFEAQSESLISNSFHNLRFAGLMQPCIATLSLHNFMININFGQLLLVCCYYRDSPKVSLPTIAS